MRDERPREEARPTEWGLRPKEKYIGPGRDQGQGPVVGLRPKDEKCGPVRGQEAKAH